MEISHQRIEGHEEIRLQGRLDANWADYLSARLEEILRAGGNDLRLDMTAIDYLSSAGIRILVIYYKRLAKQDGWLSIRSASTPVRNVLRACGLETLLSAPDSQIPSSGPEDLRDQDTIYRIVSQVSGQGMSGEVHGDFTAFHRGPIDAALCQPVAYPKGTLGIGLGGLGQDSSHTRERLGEFLAAGGAAVVMPTDGSTIADYTLATGDLVPTVISPYALKATGEFTHVVRFEPRAARTGASLPSIVEAMALLADTDTLAMLMIAVSAGLVGASVRASPAGVEYAGPTFAVSDVRQLFRVTTEPVHRDGLALVVGIASRVTIPAMAPMIRPLSGTDGLHGHFHAASLSYHPLPRDDEDVEVAVQRLLSVTRILDVLHLLDDGRPVQGLGSSRFERGMCWIAPLQFE